MNHGKQMKAFETQLMGISSIVFCATAGQAKSGTVYSAKDAGFSVRFVDCRVRRRPDLDGCYDQLNQDAFGGIICRNVAYVESLKQ